MMNKMRLIFLFVALALADVTAMSQRYADSSVLSDGSIYKLGVVSDAVYRVTYDDLVKWGVNPSMIDPRKISVFGNIAGMLPENNSTENYDDLSELSILVNGEDDGSFDRDDEVIFYGQSPVVWEYKNGRFRHQTNYYSDTTYYFLKIDNEYDGKRIVAGQQPEDGNVSVVTTFLDHQCHEVDIDNHFKMGRKWFGESVSGQTQKLVTFPFVFRNAVDGEGFVHFNFIGSASGESFTVRLAVNGEPVTDDVQVNKVGEYCCGTEFSKEATFTVAGDEVNASVEVFTNNAASMVGVDYVEVNVWRRLRYENEQLVFTLTESVGHNAVNLIEIENASGDLLFLDVTNPLSPEKLAYSMAGDMLQYEDFRLGKSYALVGPDDLKEVVSCKQIENQNLHAHSDADYAEMLIITDKVFAKQAEEIKTIHEDTDNMVSYIAFVDEIYNEFSSGSADITGIRNFIRMVYERSEGLKYVLLLGRGTCDYKNRLGYSNNFVPPYESLNVVNQLSAYVSDDYYGLMGEGEGELLAGKVSLGVGRMPVVDVNDAATAVAKIRRYIDASKSMGDWRNDIVLIADNERSTYAKNCDSLEAIVDTAQPSANITKIYSDAYIRRKNSDGSYSSPEATAEIMRRFSQGAIMVSYFGHGGVKGLSKSKLLMIEDIINLGNYDRLPFVTTATCEFSAFDNPGFVSAGERLFKMNEGGAIAMFTSTRPTQTPDNAKIMKNLYKNAFPNGWMRSRTMGEVVMETKRDNISNTSNYVSYVFFGDPALRFAYPSENVATTAINGRPDRKDHVVGAMETVTVQGQITDADGRADSLFNGFVNVKMFDNKSQYNTLNNCGLDADEYFFQAYNDVLFEGKASVKNGLFSITYMIPKNVNMQKGKARISYYAVDTTRMVDATGCFANVKVDGVADVVTDNEGPEIQLLWNGNVPDGEPVFCDGTLTAEITDPQGLYHYNTVIGRDIMLSHVFNGVGEVENVNGCFETEIDDFTKGTLKINYENLKSGEHEFVISAWDTHENNSVVSLKINVFGNDDFISLVNVVNRPNPFVDKTVFSFQCHKQDITFDLTIKIYDVAGRLVNELTYNNLTDECDGVEWDGTDFRGDKLLPGVYVYNVHVKDIDGDVYSTNQKLILSR